MPTDRLPQSFAEMIETKNQIFPPISFELGKEMQARPTDVILTPWSKSGTTWLQQIFHGLRSNGDMTFDDISRVTPWIEVANALGIDLDAGQGWEPRGFKSHYSYHAVPKGCRYVISFRDPADALVSYYRFYEGWLFEPGTVTLDEYIAPHLDRSRRKDPWTHLASWWERRDEPDTLLLSYELMLEDHRPAVVAMARFLEIEADDDLIELVTRQSTRQFMLDHESKFNDLLHRERSDAVGALPPGSGSVKVSTGEYDPERYRLSDQALETMEAHWREAVAEPYGIATYDDLTELLRRRA